MPLHLVQRGHNRGACFFDEQDYHAYLGSLGDALQREQCALHAYVLMTNHIHLLVTPRDAGAIPRFIMAIGRRYVQHINHTYGRTGTLWDSRYRSSLVEEDTYLLLCQRYIELNPVRAGMADDPAAYRWSSYRANAPGEPNALLSPHPLYLALGQDKAGREEAYRALFRTALDDEPIGELRMALNQNQPVGNARFYEEIEAMTGQRRELRQRGRPRKAEAAEVVGESAQQELPL